MPASPRCSDPVILNLWHVIGDIEDMRPNTVYQTVLLEEPISFAIDAAGTAFAWRSRPSDQSGCTFDAAQVTDKLPAKSIYGCLWTCLGEPSTVIFPIPEYFEPKRRNVSAGTIGVNVSAPRAIENFLDMGHFPRRSSLRPTLG